MAEYIKRSDALNFEVSVKLDPDKLEAVMEGMAIYGDQIKLIPAADVKPVVLCRDCDCWNDWDSAGKESLGNYVCSCAHWTVEDGAVFYTRPTDFCSYGEKREES